MFKMKILSEKRGAHFNKGDRVKLKDVGFVNEEVVGTVENVEDKGFVKVKWDKREYKNEKGKTVIFSRKWMEDKLERIQIEQT